MRCMLTSACHKEEVIQGSAGGASRVSQKGATLTPRVTAFGVTVVGKCHCSVSASHPTVCSKDSKKGRCMLTSTKWWCRRFHF